MFRDKIDSIPANCFNYGDYHDGFYQCRDEAAMVAEEADELILKLFAEISKLGGNSLVEDLKREYRL